ncbi:MAG TPA: hypothetical protein VNZ49_11850 [Bacteroidia bacterium]|jgi:hypothetical protein|nr:hypothetical protein [Bacteroidia bacterium]
MLNSNVNKAKLIPAFPLLANDPAFEITDKENINYNCIAYAACEFNEWWQALPIDKRPSVALDGVKYNWPYDVPNDSKLSTLIEIFSKKKYEVCVNGNYEDGFRKICFYGHTPDKIEHAARQYANGKDAGKWTSKLGQSFTITHGEATFIESTEYGKVLCFMRCQWP